MIRRRTTVLRLICTILFVLPVLPTAAKKKPPSHPVNLNTASASELEEVPGIGPATAQKILDARKSYGSFKSVDDLLSIKGIGPKRLDKMRKYLTVNKPPAKTHPAPQQSSSAHAKAPPPKSSTKTNTSPPAEASEDEEP
jgi:comEA protein